MVSTPLPSPVQITPPRYGFAATSRTFKVGILLLLALLAVKVGFSQTTTVIYRENFGTITSASLPAYSTGAYATYQNGASTVYDAGNNTGAIPTVRTSNSLGSTGNTPSVITPATFVDGSNPASPTTGVTASTNNNLFFAATTAGGNSGGGIQVGGTTPAGINLSGLSASNANRVGFYSLFSNSVAVQPTLEYSLNGTSWTAIAYTTNAVATWQWVTITLPAAVVGQSSVRFRFRNTNTQASTYSVRVDDFRISQTTPAPGINLTNSPPVKFIAEKGRVTDVQYFTVGAGGLSAADMTIGPATGFEFCFTAGGTFVPSLTVSPSSGTIAATNVFVRVSTVGSANVGNISATANVSQPSVTTQTVSLSASIYNTSLTVTPAGAAVPSFNPNNIVFLRIGEGQTATTATAAMSPQFIVEMTPSGTFVQEMMLPVTANGTSRRMTIVGNSTTAGALNISPDRKFLISTGYDASLYDINAYRLKAAAVAFNKVVAKISFDGTIDATTQVSEYNTDNVRGATTVDGQGFWTTAQAPTGVSALRFATLGNNGAATQGLSGTLNNFRNVQIANSQLFYSLGATTSRGIVRVNGVGTSTPKTSSEVGTTEIIATSGLTTASPYQFAFADINPAVPGNDVLYVADLGTVPGIYKYVWDGTSSAWSQNGSFPINTATTGLQIFANSPTSVDVYYGENPTTFGGATLNAIMKKFTDIGGLGTLNATAQTTLLTVPTQYSPVRGLALTPLDVITPNILVSATSPGAVLELGGGANNVNGYQSLYAIKADVSLSNAILTKLTLKSNPTGPGVYNNADILGLKLFLSTDNLLDAGDIDLSLTPVFAPGGGQTISFGLSQNLLNNSTSYLIVAAAPTGCATSIGKSIGIAAPASLAALEFAAANVTGSLAAGTNYTIQNGPPVNVSNVVKTEGDPIIPITYTLPTIGCFDQIIAVASASPITATLNPATTYLADAQNRFNLGTGTAVGGGKVVYVGTANNFTLQGLTVGNTYYVRIYTKRNGSPNFISNGVQITVLARQSILYSLVSGNHNGAIWGLSPNTPVGSAQTATALVGGFDNQTDVIIQGGTTVRFNTQNPFSVRNITILPNGILSSAGAAGNGTVNDNASINVYGNVINAGTIAPFAVGNNLLTLTFEGNGTAQTFAANPGAGLTQISRLTKRYGSANEVTNLTITGNLELAFAGAAALYSNADLQPTTFNVTIAQGAKVTLTGAGANVAIDGLDGTGSNNRGGTLTVNGTLTIPGTLFVLNDNATATFTTPLVIGSAGIVSTGTARINQDANPATPRAAAPVTIAAGGILRVSTQLTLSTGTLGAGLELLSSAGRAAQVSTLSGTAAITGIAKVEASFPAVSGWHFVSFPVLNKNVGDIVGNIRLQPRNNANMFFYSEPTPALDTVRYNGAVVEVNGWKVVTAATDALNPGNTVRGFRLYASGLSKLAVTGVPVTGNVSSPALTLTPTGFDGGGWNLIGNPYPAGLNWNSVIVTPPNGGKVQGNFYYVWDGTAKVYKAYSPSGGPLNSATNAISSGQGFLVKTLANNNTLAFTEAMKTTVNTTILRVGVDEEPAISNTNRLSITLGNGTTSDEAVLAFNGGLVGLDATDGYKLDGSISLAIQPVSGLSLVYSSMPLVSATTAVPLKVATTQGANTLTFAGIENMTAGTDLYLKDNFLGTVTPITIGMVYRFSASSNAASQGGARFMIVASPAGVTSNLAGRAASVSIYPNPSAGRVSVSVSGLSGSRAAVTVLNVNGVSVANTYITLDASGNGQLSLSQALAAGAYTVRVSDGQSVTAKKLIVQ